MRVLFAMCAVFMLGCGGAVVQTPEEPVDPPNIISSDCLEVVVPDGWVLDSASTERQAFIPSAGPGGQVTHSVMRLNRGRRQMSIMHPHGNGAWARAVFRLNHSRVQAFLRDWNSPDRLRSRGIMSLWLDDPADVTNVPGARMFIVTTTMHDGSVERVRTMIIPLDPDDPDSAIVVSTNIDPGGPGVFPSEALEIARSLRNTCM